jgi:hypothetical protein
MLSVAEAVAEAAQCSKAGKERRGVHISLVLAPEGTVRGGGLFLEPRGRPTGLFPASPLAFASLSAASCGPVAEQPAFQLGTEASRTGPAGPGDSHWRAWSSF